MSYVHEELEKAASVIERMAEELGELRAYRASQDRAAHIEKIAQTQVARGFLSREDVPTFVSTWRDQEDVPLDLIEKVAGHSPAAIPLAFAESGSSDSTKPEDRFLSFLESP